MPEKTKSKPNATKTKKEEKSGGTKKEESAVGGWFGGFLKKVGVGGGGGEDNKKEDKPKAEKLGNRKKSSTSAASSSLKKGKKKTPLTVKVTSPSSSSSSSGGGSSSLIKSRPNFRSKYGDPFAPRVVRICQPPQPGCPPPRPPPGCPPYRPFCPPLPPLPNSYPAPWGCPPLPQPCPSPCGTKAVFRVPRGSPPPFLPWGAGAGSRDQPPCYNNCNFYTLPDRPPLPYMYPPPPPPYSSPVPYGRYGGPPCVNPCMQPPPYPPGYPGNPGAVGDSTFVKMMRQAKACSSSGTPSLADSDFQAELEALAKSSTNVVRTKKK